MGEKENNIENDNILVGKNVTVISANNSKDSVCDGVVLNVDRYGIYIKITYLNSTSYLKYKTYVNDIVYFSHSTPITLNIKKY